MEQKYQNRAIGLLVRGDEILLGLRGEGIGEGNFVAIGGKQEEGEAIEQTLVREIREEIAVTVTKFELVAKIDFSHEAKPDWDQCVVVFLCSEWTGDIQKLEDVTPKWFKKSAIPFDKMWEDNKDWYPLILSGRKVKAKYRYGVDGKTVTAREITVVTNLIDKI